MENITHSLLRVWVRFFLTTAKLLSEPNIFKYYIYIKFENSTYLKSVDCQKICVALCFHFMIYKELALALFSEHRLKGILISTSIIFHVQLFLSTDYCSRHFCFTAHFRREGMKGNQLIYKCFTNSRSDQKKGGGRVMNQNFFRVRTAH